MYFWTDLVQSDGEQHAEEEHVSEPAEARRGKQGGMAG
jgi:hypothetical protein